MSIEEKVKKIISECFAFDDDELQNNDRLNDLGADSLDMLSLSHQFELAFDITHVPLRNETTVQDVINHVTQRVASA